MLFLSIIGSQQLKLCKNIGTQDKGKVWLLLLCSFHVFQRDSIVNKAWYVMKHVMYLWSRHVRMNICVIKCLNATQHWSAHIWYIATMHWMWNIHLLMDWKCKGFNQVALFMRYIVLHQVCLQSMPCGLIEMYSAKCNQSNSHTSLITICSCFRLS